MPQTERDKFLEWSRAFGIEPAIAGELLRYMPDDSDLDPELPCWISSPFFVISANDSANGLGIEEQLRRNELLIIGSCPNGDLVVVSVRNAKLPVFYVNHEEMRSKPISEIMRKISDSIADYRTALLDESSKIPLDYWDKSNG